ncbi:MAG: response regulator [Anaerolineae bacterium]|nr:response regulator [Anaerolineae bacterium]
MPKRILIVEDEANVAHALARALTMSGDYQVDRCDSAEDALERLRAEPPYDLLVTDLRMAGMSGLDLLERLPQLSPTTRTVLITAYGSPKIEARAKLLANAYLPKPFSTKSFVEVVKQALTTPPLQKPRVIVFSEEGLRAIQARMERLRTDVEALGALLFDQSGQLLTHTGQSGEFDATAFRALLGNTMSAASELGHILQDDETFDLHFHEGKQYEVYATQISAQVFLALLIERQSSASRIGMVWLYLRRAIAELRALVKQAQVEDTTTLFDADLAAGVADALDQALGLDDFAGETAAVEMSAAPRRARRAEFDLDAFLQANPPRRRTRKTTPPEETQAGAASSSPSTPDPNAVLSYEQARALGLINLDEDLGV